MTFQEGLNQLDKASKIITDAKKLISMLISTFSYLLRPAMVCIYVSYVNTPLGSRKVHEHLL